MRPSIPAALLPLLLLAGPAWLATGCRGERIGAPREESGHPATPPSAAEVPGGPPVLSPEGVRRPPAPPRMSWPSGFRLLESGSLGPEVRPVFWWTLDAGDTDPARATVLAREALARRFGEDRVPGPPAVAGERAVTAWIGTGRRAAISARRTGGRCEVRVVLATGVE